MSNSTQHEPSPHPAETAEAMQHDHHDQADPHRTESRLAEITLGGQDGLVNTLGVILGVAAASQDIRLVLAAGLAAAFAESVSMGAVAFTSTQANWEHYQAEEARELRHVREVPHVEREEIHDIFRSKGFEGELLERIVDTITQNKRTWVRIMMSEEHQLQPIARWAALRSGIIVGVSAMIGSLIPLTPFFFLPVKASIWCALAVSAAALFGFGAYKRQQTIGNPLRGGIELTVIGIVSALVDYGIGLLFRVAPG